MAKQTVYVEMNPETALPIRIFRTMSDAFRCPQDRIATMARSVAVGYIRQQVIARTTKNRLTRCEFCGKIITENTGHMHEVLPKGNGGEVSLYNCRFICAACHIGPDGEHGNRKWGGRDAEKKETEPDGFE